MPRRDLFAVWLRISWCPEGGPHESLKDGHPQVLPHWLFADMIPLNCFTSAWREVGLVCKFNFLDRLPPLTEPDQDAAAKQDLSDCHPTSLPHKSIQHMFAPQRHPANVPFSITALQAAVIIVVGQQFARSSRAPILKLPRSCRQKRNDAYTCPKTQSGVMVEIAQFTSCVFGPSATNTIVSTFLLKILHVPFIEACSFCSLTSRKPTWNPKHDF